MITWILSSLFFAPHDVPVSEDKEGPLAPALPEATKPAPSDLVLQGILYLPDTGQWIVWINGIRIDSRRPQSIMGWSVVSVHVDHVVVTSAKGGQRELWLQQDTDQDDRDAPLAMTDTMAEAITEPTTETTTDRDDPEEPPADPLLESSPEAAQGSDHAAALQGPQDTSPAQAAKHQTHQNTRSFAAEKTPTQGAEARSPLVPAQSSGLTSSPLSLQDADQGPRSGTGAKSSAEIGTGSSPVSAQGSPQSSGHRSGERAGEDAGGERAGHRAGGRAGGGSSDMWATGTAPPSVSP